MDVLSSIVLGITQGFTEFLPVSSSAHLLIIPRIIHMPEPTLVMGVLLHLATLLAVVIYFFRDIVKITVAFFKSFAGVHSPESRMGWMIILATVPTGIIGLAFKDFFEQFFSATWYMGIFLIVTAVVLMLADKLSKANKDIRTFTWLDSILVGTAQAVAILPGISRSGSTIAASLLCGLDRQTAARFSFLLSIPAILGAVVVEMKDIAAVAVSVDVVAALVAAFLSGLLAIHVFVVMIKNKKMSIFSYYCFFIGFVIIIDKMLV